MADGRLVETREGPTGPKVFEIGRVRVWDRPNRLVFGWRQATFEPDQDTEVTISFEQVGEETRVAVEHRGWDAIPATHVAKHTFPNDIFLRRHGEWWHALLTSYRDTLS